MQYDFPTICVKVWTESEKVSKKMSSFFYRHHNLPGCFHAVKFWVRKCHKSVGPWTIPVSQFVIFNKCSPNTRIQFFDKLKVVFDKKWCAISETIQYLSKMTNYETGVSHGPTDFLRVRIQKSELFHFVKYPGKFSMLWRKKQFDINRYEFFYKNSKTHTFGPQEEWTNFGRAESRNGWR